MKIRLKRLRVFGTWTPKKLYEKQFGKNWWIGGSFGIKCAYLKFLGFELSICFGLRALKTPIEEKLSHEEQNHEKRKKWNT